MKPVPCAVLIRRHLRYFLATTLLGPAPMLIAQTVVSPKDATNAGDSAVVLSPFTVSSDKDTGYTSASTLAGTRLNTPVKDLGASISIYTKDFLTDIGVTNARELMVYGSNSEVSGAGGNYSGAADSINQASIVPEITRTTSQGQSRTRGLSSPNNARGYFLTNIPFDSYNTDSVTNIRGPNAILFGVGSPAGVVEATPSKADTIKNSNRVEMRFGNNGAVRGVLDFNRVLIPKKLGVRLIGLADDEEFNQRPAFEHQRRLYSAMTFEPFKTTVIRANYENGRHIANRPIPTLPFKSWTKEWENLGRPYFDWAFYDDPARNPNAATQDSYTEFRNNIPFSYVVGPEQRFYGVGLFMDATAQRPTTGYIIKLDHTTGTLADAIRQGIFHPTVNRDSAIDQHSDGFLYGTRNISEMPGAFFPGGLQPAGTKAQGFINEDEFDWTGRLLDETSRQRENYHGFNVSFEQRAWEDRVGIEVAYDQQRYYNHRRDAFFNIRQTTHVKIELTAVLPDGTPNPNLGRPWVQTGQSNFDHAFTDRETVRTTAYLKYNFEDLSPKLGFWLGRHAVNGLYEKNAVESINYSTRIVSDDPRYNALFPAADSGQRRPVVTVYLGPSVLAGGPVRLSPIQIGGFEAGTKFDTNYFSAPAGSTAQGQFVKEPTQFLEIIGTGAAGREVVKSKAAVLQSYWLAEHLVTLVGWRRDEDYNVRQNIFYNAADQTKVAYGFNDFKFDSTPRFITAKETKTYSAVLKWPQKLLRLPAGTDLSIFGNRAENFTPQANRTDGYANPLVSPTGKTKEYGANLSLFNGKFELRATKFETAVTGVTFDSPAYNLAYNNLVLQTLTIWEQERNINPSINRSAEMALMRSVLPANFLELNRYVVTGSAATQNIFASYNQLSTRSDTTDFTAKGIELEAIYNPTKNWRILANLSKQETVQTNVAPVSKEFMARMRPIWDRLKDLPRGNYPIGHVLGTPLPASEFTIGQYVSSLIDVPLASSLANEGAASAEQRKWRANFVTNYSFDRSSIFDGRLNGFGIGTGVRMQAKLGIGYPISRNPAGSVVIDIKHPYYAPAETNVDAWISYGRKVYRDKINWRVQLNVRNLIGDQSLIGINTQPDGSIATMRIPPEKRWYLTNTFTF